MNNNKISLVKFFSDGLYNLIELDLSQIGIDYIYNNQFEKLKKLENLPLNND